MQVGDSIRIHLHAEIAAYAKSKLSYMKPSKRKAHNQRALQTQKPQLYSHGQRPRALGQVYSYMQLEAKKSRAEDENNLRLTHFVSNPRPRNSGAQAPETKTMNQDSYRTHKTDPTIDARVRTWNNNIPDSRRICGEGYLLISLGTVDED